MSDHEYWEELAAGYALSALEPEELQVFTAHLAGCLRCRDAVDEHTFVAAQLGTLASDDVDAPAWDSIRTAVLPAPTVSLDEVRARRRAPRWLSAAAGLVLVAGGGLLAWHVEGSGAGRSAQQVALQSCAKQPGCHVVHLDDKASLVVSGDQVRVLPTGLRPPAANLVYVLWQLPRDGKPTSVTVLAHPANGAVGEAHSLALPYAETAAFGLSLERANTVPARPTKVVAVGPA
jgi:hypothetical protein